LVHGGWLST